MHVYFRKTATTTGPGVQGRNRRQHRAFSELKTRKRCRRRGAVRDRVSHEPAQRLSDWLPRRHIRDIDCAGGERLGMRCEMPATRAELQIQALLQRGRGCPSRVQFWQAGCNVTGDECEAEMARIREGGSPCLPIYDPR